MNLAQAIEHANTITFPGFIVGDEALTAERLKNEEAIGLLVDAWRQAPAGREPFPFDLVTSLADRNRDICDEYGTARLRTLPASCLARALSPADLVRSVAALQHRDVAAVERSAGRDAADLGIAYVEAPVSGIVCGIDLETTDRDPSRGYIVNVGIEFWDMGPKTKPIEPNSAYCGLPDIYRDGVPLEEIHHITWKDVQGKKPFRDDRRKQRALLDALSTYPFMAHNAAFEDSWLTLHLDGYAEARKAGKVVPVDTRDICRRIDPEYKTLPHDSHPAALESWARRRHTLKANQKERHLGLEDVDLMFRTVQAEFKERNMFGE